MISGGITDTALVDAESVGDGIQTPFRSFLSDFCENKIAVISFVVVVVVIMIALFAPFISPTDPYDLAIVTVADKALSPGMTMLSGQVAYLGTDGSGRDLLSSIFYGLRISLTVGIGSGVIALAIGVVIGLSAAYFGGRTDALIMRLVDMQLSFPAILIALVLLVTL
ncbi:MAG TPA: ABC transporter permease, partial [Gammaproteobacteria bacterium]|nr:ABC transporter permease [Gammaproteobacteria bacterium]